ncbi:MAG: peptidase domain-containing ABC transporter [Saprospiraceae bacterium]|nr:peptidase domain-containing ABC transporter [Saprospiraceae bacterium]MDP5049984.1 peptidase domain-containing ABC transporter [Saprospiraceae bacterium]
MPKRFPFYPQLEAMDCGSTCLRMVAKFYGRFYSLEYLREISNTGKDGVSLLDLSEAAELIGLKTLAVEADIVQLQDVIPKPCIINWGNNHFVVVYHQDSSKVWIADPAQGKYKLNNDEFIQKWIDKDADVENSGIVLICQSTPDFYTFNGKESQKGSWQYVSNYFKQYKALIFQIIIGLFLGSTLQLLFPFFIKSIVDIGINNNDLSFIALVLIAQLILFISQISVEFIRNWNILHVGSRVNISLLSDFLIKLTKLPFRFFDTKLPGDLIQRFNDHERVQKFLSSTSLISIFSILNLIAFGVVLLFWNKAIFTIFIIGSLLNIVWVLGFMKWRKTLDIKRFEYNSDNQNSINEMITGMQDIKLFNAEKLKRWSWEKVQAKLFNTETENLKLEQVQRAGALFFNETKNLLIIYLVAQGVLNTTLTLGMLVAIQYIIGQLNMQINQLTEFLKSMQDAKISLERIGEIHLKENETLIEENNNVFPSEGDIVLENVNFSYVGVNATPNIKNINLGIPNGKITAILGPSGSGKTTLLKILLNLYKPTEGVIKFGELNLLSVNPRLWRSKIGVVMQDGHLFSDSIAKNIALGEEIIDKRKLQQSINIANLQSYIEYLPLGYNTVIGPEGQGLSQGQKQRILIARAVYKEPDFLFFDEATSALDTFNEMLILENIKAAFNNKTIVIVSHRLSTVLKADQIVVMEDGEMIEVGSHEELTFVRGAYYQLVKNTLELGY